MARMFTMNLDIEPEGQRRIRARWIPPKGTRPGFVSFFTDPQTRKYEAKIRAAAIKLMGSHARFDGPLTMTIDAMLPVPKSWSNVKFNRAVSGVIRPTVKPDGDNIVKSVKDAFKQVVWEDDAQVVDHRCRKFYARAPSLRITVRETELGIFEVEDS